MSTDSLEAENAKLRARVRDLERMLYPPPASPADRTDGTRYLLAAAHEGGDDPRQRAWGRVQELFVAWAFEYMRERHPEVHLQRADFWDDVPNGAAYTTVRAAFDAKKATSDVPFYEIDERTTALEAIEAEQQRIRDRESELLEALPSDRDAHRVWAYRYHVLSEATRSNGPLDRAFQLACTPLADYEDVVRAATQAADDGLERERQITLGAIPGYRSDGSWICDKCGYPFDDSATCFTCDACHEADPRSRAAQQRNIDLVASDPKYGGRTATDRLIESRRLRLESLRWAIDGSAGG